jgi:hypothetical protein
MGAMMGRKVEAAYRRGGLFEKGRRMMTDGAAFSGAYFVNSGKVVSLNKCGINTD